MEATVAQLGLNSGVPIPTMSVLMRFLILKYYSQYYSFCTVGNDFLQDVPLSRIVLSLYDQLNTSMLHAIDNGCQAFVVDEQGAERFLDLYMPVHDLARQRSLDKSLILLIAKRNQTHLFDRIRGHEAFRGKECYVMLNHSDYAMTTIDVFHAHAELANVLIVVYDEQERPTDLYNTVVDMSDVLERSVNVAMELVAVKWTSWKNHSFFPDKARDLNGYVLRTSMCNYLPFTGYERLVEDEDEWGDVYPNGTGIGLMGSVAERRTDIAFGAFYLWFKPYNFSSYTATISRSGVTVLVPKPKLLPHWRTPFLSFSWPLWIAVMVTFLVGIIATWLAGTVRLRLLLLSAPTDQPWTGRSDLISEQLTLSDAVLMMVGFFVAQSSPIRTDLWSCVCLFASLLLAGFMVSNLYSGGLASVMTVPKYEKSIDTVVDFAATGMKWFGPTPYCLEEIWNASEQIQKTYIAAGPEEMNRYAHMGGSGFIVEQAQHGNFAPSNFLDRQVSTTLQPLKDYVYTQNCAALITNTNPLRSNLNEYILRVQQSGLLYHLGIRTAIRYLPTDVMRNIERSRMHQIDDGAVRLELGHFLGAFFILGYGLLCASLVFVGELWGTVMMRRWNETFVSKATVVTAY
ncbi:AGAP012969-PA [Anopheles gambiae str. PEST]|uniref:AGAP012969-PA n=1 Tax=Anopheles gambiae TaxID=7165 RepID=F5HLN2_ANOGA|nr:AGAP012969-PA [Anopheles gambiae str. PEST]